MFGLEADHLSGPWKRVEKQPNEFLGAPGRLVLPDGTKPNYHQISHPELIRLGYDERLEVPNTDFQMIFQALMHQTWAPIMITTSYLGNWP